MPAGLRGSRLASRQNAGGRLRPIGGLVLPIGDDLDRRPLTTDGDLANGLESEVLLVPTGRPLFVR